MEPAAKPQNVNEYIAGFPVDVRALLQKMREVIAAAAPGAAEKISYGMPAYALHGILVYFAAHRNHIGFYPTPGGIEAFREELSGYKMSKGAVQFPLGGPLPWELIGRIVRYRAAENMKRQ